MSQKPPDVFGVDNPNEDEEVRSVEIVQIVAAPPGWSAVITPLKSAPPTAKYGLLPIACFALVELTFSSNDTMRIVVAQVVSYHGKFVDAASLENFAGVIGPGTDPQTVLAAFASGKDNVDDEG